ncbi:MAG: T9SS type A sorting domain-containing protein [Candidatus Kapabacteria bacterium]|nr:T9SS type A sorting domain-containing protein [Candidatus Kapabacteria bacterium]
MLHLQGDANPGQIDIFVQNIGDNLLNVQAAQDQHTIGLLSLCQPPVATIGQNQRAGGPYNNEVYSWVPDPPALAGTQNQLFYCPSINVPCGGVGGVLLGTIGGPGPNYDQGFFIGSPGTWYYYTETTLNNCTKLTSNDLGVVSNPQPSAIAITGTQNVCEGGTVNYSVVPSTATSLMTWGTTAPGVTIITSGAQNQNASITYPAGGSNAGTSYNITVNEVGPAPTNCAFLNTYVNRVTIFTNPTGPLTVAPGAICAVASGSANVTYTANAGYFTYSWSFVTNTVGATFPAGNTNTKVVTVTNQPVQPAAPATVTVQLQAFNDPGNLCPGPKLQTSFTVNPLPPVNTVDGAPATICAQQLATYTITGTIIGGNTYTYTASVVPYVWQGGYVQGASTGATAQTIQWTAAGTGVVTVLETTPSGCTRQYSTSTVVNPLPTPSIVGSNTPCQFVPATLGNPSYQSAPNPIEYTYTLNSIVVGNSYRWAITGGGGTITAANAATTTVLPATSTTTPGNVNLGVSLITVRWAAAGAGTVTVDERTANGCNASSTLNVTVIATPPAGNFGVTGALTTCATPAAPIAYSTTGGVGTHTVTVVGGNITAVTAPFVGLGSQTSGTGAVANAFTIQWGAAGTGTISDEYTEGGCVSVETYTITINPNPSFTIAGPGNPICGSSVQPFTIVALVNGGGAPSYLWAEVSDVDVIGTLGANGAATMNVTFLNPPGATSSYTLNCTVTNTTTGCDATIAQAFTITQVPAAPVITPVAIGCAASTEDPVSFTSWIFTNVAGTLTITLVNAPAGTTIASPTAHTGVPTVRSAFWGVMARNPALAPISQVVTANATITAAGCTSPVGTTNTTVYARPAPAPIVPLPPLCINTIVPIPVAVATNGGLGQPGVDYTWATGGVGPVTLNAAGAAPDLTRQITALNGAGAKTITVTGTDPVSGCATSTVSNFIVDPEPTPVVSGPVAACQELTNPVGKPHNSVWSFTYDYQTTLNAANLGNSFSWQVSNAYIVAYSVDNGANYISVAGNVAPLASQLLPSTVNASRIRVVMYGATPAKVKVTETHPGGCGATTPDYNVALNIVPTQYALGVTPQNICNTGTQTAPLNLANSQTGFSYQVQRSTDAGASWTNAAVAAQNGATGVGLNFTVLAGDLAFTTVAPAPTVYLFRVVATTIAPSNPIGCGPYVVSLASATVNVHQIPNAALAVTIATTPVCFGSLVNVSVAGSQNWVTYTLERALIANNSTGVAIPPVWLPTGVSAVGNNGALPLNDNTSPVGGFPLLSTPNYQYRVIAVSNVSPPACTVTLTQQPTATVFALPVVQANSFTPNPVCWKQPVIFTQASSQDGVTYEILNNAASMTPPVTFNGTGAAIGPITIPALSVLPANPAAPTIVNFTVRALLRTGAGVYARPIPASACPVVSPITAVTVNPKPVASVSGTNPACGPSVGTYTAAAGALWAKYDWKILGTVDGAPNNPPTGTAPTFVNGGAFGTVNPFVTTWGTSLLSCNGSYNPLPVQVRMIETNVFGCADTAIYNVTINPTVADAAISGPTTACIYGGFEEHLTSYKVKRPGLCVFPAGTTFLWTMPTGPVVGVIRSGQGTDSIVAEWNATGGTNIGQINLAITLPAIMGGCVTNVTYNVTVYPQPQPIVTGPTNVCQNSVGSPTSTSVYSATLFTGDTYKWDVIGGTITTPGGATGTGVVGDPSSVTALNGNSITVTWGNVPNLNASVILTQTSTVGCINRNTLNVVVNPTPNPVVSGPGIVCDNSVSSYSTANNAPSNTYVWTIAGNGTILTGANQAAITVLSGAIGGGATCTLTLTATTSATTCSRTVSRIITIVPTPAPTITRLTAGGATGGACLNQVIQYGQTDLTVGTFSYKWTATSGIISDVTGNNPGPDSGTTVYVKWNTVGTGTVTLAKWHTSSQCTTTVSQNVAITNPPAPAITGPTAVCGEQTATYSTPNVIGNTYSWSFSNGALISGGGTNAITIKFTNPGAGSTLSSNVTVVETNTLSGCTGQTTVEVTIRYQPQVQTIAGPTQACAYNAVTNPASVNYSVVNNPSSTYQWTATGATIVGSSTTNTVAVRWTSVGTQTITAVEKDVSGNCSATSTLNVAVTYQPTPTITGNLNSCSNSTDTYSTPAVAGSTYAWTVSDLLTDRTLSGLTNNSITITWLTAGSRTLSVTETAGLCTATANATVTVTAKPAPVITRTSPAGLINQACLGSTITYSTPNGGGTTYLWTVTGGTIAGLNNTNAVTINWTALGNQTLTVMETAVANTGCFMSNSINVSVEEQPNPVITGGTPVCSGSTQVYSVTAVPGHVYLWSVSGLAADRTIVSGLNGSSMTVTWNNANTYTVQVVQTNNTGNCTRTATLAVVVQQTPTATAISRITPGGAVNQACQGQTIQYSTPANGASSYLWTSAGGVIVGAANTNAVTVTWQTIGNNTLTVTETTTGTPCFRTVTQNVAVSYTPTPNITGSTVVCINKEHTYSTPAVPGSTYNWLITPANVFATIAGYPTSNTITVRWIQPGLHTMSVTETALGGFCFTTTTVNIRVNPIPTPDIQSATGYGNPITRRPGIVCNFSSHVYSVTPTPGNVFQWVVTGGTITAGSNTNSITVLWAAAGNGTIACTETVPGSDCITTDRDTILIRPTPTPSITGQVNPCGNSVQDYTTTFVSGNTYTWTVVGGSFVTIAPNTIRVTWSSPLWPNTTVASVAVREDVADVLLAGTCFGTNTLNVTLRPIPLVPTITGPSPVCATDLSDSPQTINTATYNSSVPVIGAGSGSVTPTWTVTSGTIVSGQGTYTIGVQWSNGTLSPITGTLTVTHLSSFGCSATGSLNVTINPLPNPIITGPTSVCQNSLQNYSTQGIPGNTYSWTITGGNIIRAGQGTPNVTVEWTLPGAATITVSEINSFLCTVLNTLNITVNALPSARITASGSTTFCQGGDVTLSVPIGFTSYVWNTGETARSIVVRTTGKYWCTVTDANGCSNSSDTMQINVFPTSLPIVAINGPTTFCEGGSVTLTAPAGFTAYRWSTGATTQSIVVLTSGTYTVTIADGNGCTGTSTDVDVVVNPKPRPVLTLIGSPALCSGDSVEVRAPAGYVSYSWVATSGNNYGTSRTIIVRQTDTIYCQVVDVNGCVGTSDSARVKTNSIVRPVVTANGPTTFCDGGAVTLTAPAGYASYIWSNGSTGRSITVQNAGEFWVTVTNNTSCPALSTKTPVIVNSLPVVPTISRMGDVLSANSAVAQAWQWFRNGTMISGATAKTYTVGLPGSYRVEIADNNTCASVSDAFDVILTDVDEDIVAGRQAELRLFPNPSNGQFSIETSISQAGPVRIELVNAIGELVMTLNEAANGGTFRTSVDMGILAHGVYNVVVTTGNERWVVRLVRQ